MNVRTRSLVDMPRPSTTRKGRRLEAIVAAMQRFLEPALVVRRNAPIWDRVALVDRDFDVTTHDTAAGSLIAAIECKHHDRPVDVGTVDALRSRAEDCGVKNVTLVSSSGFTPAAQRKALHHGILPLVFVEDKNTLAIPEWFVPTSLGIRNNVSGIDSASIMMEDGSSPTLKDVPLTKKIIRIATGQRFSLHDLARHLTEANRAKFNDQLAESTEEAPVFFRAAVEFTNSDDARIVGRRNLGRVVSVPMQLRYWRLQFRVPLMVNALETIEGDQKALAVVSHPIEVEQMSLRIAFMFKDHAAGHRINVSVLAD